MSGLLFSGGTVVSAEGSYRADVLVEDEKIVAVGVNLDMDGAETVDASGKLVMPGFIDAHTHMDMPFGGTVTADDWATGTEAAAAGGTTMIIDFALQEAGGTLAGAFDTWTEKARDKAVIDYSFHVAITDLRDDIKAELPDLAEKGVASVKIFMAYKGTPLYTEDEDLFEALQLSKDAGVLVMVHAENGDAIAKLQQQALSRGDTAPRFHALTRPEPVEAEATNRAIRLAEVAGAPILVVHVSCAPALEAIHLAHERGQTVYAETCPQYFAFEYEDLAREGFEGAKYVCSPPPRDPENRPALWNGLKFGDLQIFGSDHCSFNYREQKELGKDDFTLIPNGLPGAEERAMTLWRSASARGNSPRTSSSPSSRPTRRASTAPTREREPWPRAPTRTSYCGTPSSRRLRRSRTVTVTWITRPTRGWSFMAPRRRCTCVAGWCTGTARSSPSGARVSLSSGALRRQRDWRCGYDKPG